MDTTQKPMDVRDLLAENDELRRRNAELLQALRRIVECRYVADPINQKLFDDARRAFQDL